VTRIHPPASVSDVGSNEVSEPPSSTLSASVPDPLRNVTVMETESVATASVNASSRWNDACAWRARAVSPNRLGVEAAGEVGVLALGSFCLRK